MSEQNNPSGGGRETKAPGVLAAAGCRGGVPAPARTLDEIKISIRAHSRMAAENILQIGRDLMEAKQIAGHGGWLPFLSEIGFKPSTAENWMRLAREIEPGSPLAQLSPTKALALLSLPAEDREDFARENEADTKSAAELRRLIEERNRAAEAANAESNRANEAEKQLAQARRSADYYAAQAGQIEKERQDAERRAQELARELEKQMDQPVSIRTVEVEKAPADYEQLKQRVKWADQNVDEAMRAAMDAEARAREAEAEAERLRAQQAPAAPQGGMEQLTEAVNTFISAAQLMGVNPGPLAARKREFDALMKRIKLFILDLEKAVDDADWAAEGAVT